MSQLFPMNARALARLVGRAPLVRLTLIALAGVVLGSLVTFLAERNQAESEYSSFFQTVLNIFILFMSGFDAARPQTLIGTITSFLVLAMGICFIGLFTAEIAALLVERRMKGTEGLKPVRLSGHYIITRWSKDTEEIIRELHSDDVKDKRPVVVIDRTLNQLPITDPLVDFVRGDPTETNILERAGVMEAHTALILSNTAVDDYNTEDSRNILICLAIETLNRDVYTVVQVLNPENRKHLERADCDEVICSTELSTQLVVQSSLNHGLSKFFGSILTFTEGSEIYRVRLSSRFAGKPYFELGSELMTKHQMSLLALESDGTLHVNEATASVKEGDHAFVLAVSFPVELENGG